MRQCSLSLSRRFRTILPKLRTYSLLARKVEQHPTHIPITVNHAAHSDPFALVSSELTQIRERLLNLLSTAHPGLHDMAECLFRQPSIHLRSLLILLFSRATNGLGENWRRKTWEAHYECITGQGTITDDALYDPSALRDWHPAMPDHASSFGSVFQLRSPTRPSKISLKDQLSALSPYTTPIILPSQIRLAQIMEMIHIASLLHDGVHDDSNLISNGAGDKLTILGGDFLLGRASAVLPRLGENEVVELVSGIISNLVEGEMLRMKGSKAPKFGSTDSPASIPDAWDLYWKKIYLKNASLMAKGTRASVILGGCQDGDVREVAYVYGRNVGFAKQLMDDASDYKFGRVQPGIAAAPALYALQEYPELLPIIDRHLTHDDDIDRVLDKVHVSSAVERTRNLARTYADKAREALRLLPESESADDLEKLVDTIVDETSVQ